MSYLPKTKAIFLRCGTATALILCCSLLLVWAQDSSTHEDVLRLEKQADELRNDWSEPAIRQASELYLRAAGLREKAKDFQSAAKCLRESVKLKLMLSEEKSIAALLEKSLQLENKTKNIGGLSETYSLLTHVAIKLSDLKKGANYQRQALKTAAEADQPEVLAGAYFAAAAFAFESQNFSGMNDFLEKALGVYRETGNRKGEAEVLTELAYCAIINNDRIKGRDFAQSAVEIARAINYRRQQAFALIALGDAYQRMGEWESAIKIFYEAQSLYPDNLDVYEKAILTNRIGFYNLTFGNLDQAAKYFQDALQLFNKIGREVGSSELLSILGEIAIAQKNYGEATDYFNRSRKIAEKSNNPIALGMLDLKIGESLYLQEKLPEAEKYFLSSLVHYNKIGTNFRIADVREKLGLVYEKEERFEKARENYLAALNINRMVLNKFGQAEDFYNLARLDFLENEFDKSFENIKESIKLTESSQSETANNQLKRSFFSRVHDRYGLYINLLMIKHRAAPDGDYARQALQAAEMSRARVMLENISLSKADFIKDADAETVKRETEIRNSLNSKADRLIDLLSGNAGKTETDRLSQEIGELENELETIKAQLKQRSPIYSAIKNPAPFDVAEFQRNILDEKSLLLEFSLGTNESYLWVIGKNEVGSYVLPPRAEIEKSVETLRELLTAREPKADETVEDYQQRVGAAERDYERVAKDLSQKLFGQISAKLPEKRLIVVPDGELHYFPIAALPLPASTTDEPILLSNETIYEPSAQTLAVLSGAAKQSPPTAKDLLVFSDPIFSSDDARFSPENKPVADMTAENSGGERFRFVDSLDNLPRLAASKDESETIIKTVGAGRVENYSGFAATRENLLNLKTDEYKILHFATHGYVNENRPELSGIVLSRYDRTGQKLNEFFRIQDIYALDLNADLVVLSACETGVGKEFKGEGLMSLNNAFLQTGAKTVMASLWKVEDGATLELMKNFYGALAGERLTPSESLRRAQIKLRENPQYKSPFYWAAFTVQGDFRSVPNLSGGFGIWVYLLAFLPLPLVGLYFYKRRLKFRR